MGQDDSDQARYTSAHAICTAHGRERDDDVPAILARCTPFRRLDAHAAACAPLMDAPVNRLRARLAELARRGLLISEQECLARHDRSAPGAADVDEIGSVGILTRDRPGCVRRCLDSLAETMRPGRRLRLVMADESTTAAACDENRAALRRAGARIGVPVQYIGREQKARMVDQLAAASGAPRRLVGLALQGAPGFGPTTGANRNTLLLATAGELTLQVDDDVHWRVAVAPGQAPGVRYGAANADPTDVRFHRDRAGVLASVPAVDRDPLELHETLLGRTLGNVLAGSRDSDRPIADGAIDPLFVHHLIEGSGRVIATSFGVAGDCATWSSHPLLLVRGRSRDSLFANYDDAVRTREIVRAAPQITLMRGGFFMSMAVGLDNRVLLPPFFPVARNQDGSFGVALPLCSPESYVAHLPWLIAHQPDPPRVFEPDAVWANAGAVRVSDLVIQSLLTWRPPASSSARDRLVALGVYLEELGRIPAPEFLDLMRSRLLDWLNGYRRLLEANLRAAQPLPAAYERAAARQLDELEAKAGSAKLVCPTDVDAGDAGDALDRFQALLGEFGRLLQVWPALLDAAEDLSVMP